MAVRWDLVVGGWDFKGGLRAGIAFAERYSGVQLAFLLQLSGGAHDPVAKE